MSVAAWAFGGGAIVRPANHDRSLLIRYLNMGADGLMVPMVETADQAPLLSKPCDTVVTLTMTAAGS